MRWKAFARPVSKVASRVPPRLDEEVSGGNGGGTLIVGDGIMERVQSVMPSLCLLFRPAPPVLSVRVPMPARVLRRIATGVVAYERVNSRMICEACRIPGCIVWIQRAWKLREEQDLDD